MSKKSAEKKGRGRPRIYPKGEKRPRPKGDRTVGAVLLLRTGKDHDTIAIDLGTTRSSVTSWISCRWKPSDEMRAAMFDAYGIPVVSWDQAYVAPKRGAAELEPVDAPKPPTLPTGAAFKPNGSSIAIPPGMLPQLVLLERTAHELLGELSSPDSKTTPLERAKVAKEIGAVLQSIATIRGDYDLGKQLFRLPLWATLKDAAVRALKDHPGALEALAAELRKLEREQLGESP